MTEGCASVFGMGPAAYACPEPPAVLLGHLCPDCGHSGTAPACQGCYEDLMEASDRMTCSHCGSSDWTITEPVRLSQSGSG